MSLVVLWRLQRGESIARRLQVFYLYSLAVKLHQVLACREKEKRYASEALKTYRTARHWQVPEVDVAIYERRGLTSHSSLSQFA